MNAAVIMWAMQRGNADGLVMNFTAFPAFRLHEVTTDHLIAPLGGALGLVFMMRDRYDALPEAAREVLARHTGCDDSRALGAQIDAWENDALGFVRSQGERRFHTLSDEQVAELVARVGGPIEAAFTQRTPGGADLLAAYRVALAEASGQ